MRGNICNSNILAQDGLGKNCHLKKFAKKGNLKQAQQFPRYDRNRKQFKIKINVNLYRNIEDMRAHLNFENVPTNLTQLLRVF